MRGVESLTDIDEDVAVDLDGEICDTASGSLRMHERRERNTSTSPALAGGDVDAQWEMAALDGDEAVGGSMMTPDQNEVDLLGEALGFAYADDEELWCGTRQTERDAHRWELDPASAEDWDERRKR